MNSTSFNQNPEPRADLPPIEMRRLLTQRTADASSLAVFWVQPSGRFCNVNEAACRYLGFESEELLTLGVWDIDPEWTEELWLKLGWERFKRTSPTTLESRHRRKDGSIFRVEIHINFHQIEGQEFLLALVHDVTERQLALEKLRASEERLRALVISAADAIITVSTSGRIISWNPAAQRMFGFSGEEILGQPISAILPERFYKVSTHEIAQSVRNNVVFLLQNLSRLRYSHQLSQRSNNQVHFLGTEPVELVGLTRDRREFPVEVTVAMYDTGEGFAFAGMIRDITRRKQAEQERQLMEIQLRQSQKLESVGRLAAGIAHEINTPTQYIGDNNQFLKDAFRDINRLLTSYAGLCDAVENGTVTPNLLQEVRAVARETDLDYLLEEIPRAISQSLEGVQRVTKIVRAMKDFSHPGSEEKMAVDINRAIESTITVCRNEWKYLADMNLNLDSGLAPVPCLPGEFNQVILNLVINAAHAIADVVGDGSKGKGLITISTSHTDDRAEVRVEDNGKGIPEALKSRLFEPFFTTKPVGKGTGQGLAMARSVIVDKHGGTIAFDSQEGKGTVFIVTLPLTPSPAAKGK